MPNEWLADDPTNGLMVYFNWYLDLRYSWVYEKVANTMVFQIDFELFLNKTAKIQEQNGAIIYHNFIRTPALH